MKNVIDWGAYYRDRRKAPRLDRSPGEKIDDPAFFSPTHRQLLDRGPGWVQSFTVISAAMDDAVDCALWDAGVYEDQRANGVFVVFPRENAKGNHYIRISKNSKNLIKVSHSCPDCKDTELSCRHLPVAVCALEATSCPGSPMAELARSVKDGGRPGGRYTGEQETHYIRLMDELYYTMRYGLELENKLMLYSDRAPKRTFEECKGNKIDVGVDTPGTRKTREKSGRKQAKKTDWSRFVVDRGLTAEEKPLVPTGIFYLDSSGEEELATEVVFNRDPLLIVGPAGTGKSRLARRVFEHLGLPLLVISASSDRDLYSLVVSVGLKDGQTVEVPAKILTAARNGYGLLIDEVAALKPDRAMLLNSALQERELDLGTGTVALHEDCRIVATCNEGDEYTGSYGLDPSTLDRFFPLYLDYLSEGAEVEVVAKESGNPDRDKLKRMVKVARKTRKLYEHGEMSRPVTTRDVIRWSRYAPGHDASAIAEMMLIPAVAKDEEERLTMKDILDEVFNKC